MLLFSLKRDLRPVAYQTGRIRSSISYRTRASFHMVRAKLQSYDRYPLVARAFFFRIRNERLLEIRGPTSRGSALKNSGRLRKISDKRFYACHQRVRLLFSLTETSTSHPRDSATHSPLPTIPTDRSRKKERRQFRSETIAAHIESIRFHVSRHATSSDVRIVGPPYAIQDL